MLITFLEGKSTAVEIASGGVMVPPPCALFSLRKVDAAAGAAQSPGFASRREKPFTFLLADLPSPPINEVGHVLWSIAGIIIIAGALLHTWNEGRKALGRRPPLDETVNDLREDVDELRQQIIAASSGMIPRKELEQRLAQIEAAIIAQEKDSIKARGDIAIAMERIKCEIVKAGAEREAHIIAAFHTAVAEVEKRVNTGAVATARLQGQIERRDDE